MRRTPLALSVLTCAAVAVVPVAAQAAQPVAVAGSLASLTGSASAYGISQARGVSLAAQQSKGAPGVRVAVLGSDDQSSNDMAKWQMTGFVGSRVGAVLGPTLSGAAAAADPIAVAAGIPVLAVTNTTLDITAAGPTVWRVCLGEDQLIPASVAYAKANRGVRTAALVSVTGDAYSEGAAAQFRAAAAAQGITLTADVTMPMGSPNADAVVAQAVATGPQAIFFAARSTDASNLLVAAAGFTGTKVGGNGYNTPDVLQASGPAAEGLIVSASWNPGRTDARSRAFIRAYRAKYGTTPDAFAAQGYGGVQVLRQAVADGRGTTAVAVQRGLTRITRVTTVLGQLTFPGSSHEAVYPATVQVVSGGRLVVAPGGVSS